MVHLRCLLVLRRNPVERLQVKAVPTFWGHMAAGKAGLRACFGTTCPFQMRHLIKSDWSGRPWEGRNSTQGSGTPPVGFLCGWAWGLGWNLWDQIGKCCLPWGWLVLPGFWVRVQYNLRVRGCDVGGTVPEESSGQQFLEGIVDLAEVRVISSGLGSAVPAQILGSVRWGSLVYHLPQAVLWWSKNRSEAPWGLCQARLFWGWVL